MVVLGDEAHVKAILIHLEILLILTQDRCTVCTERTTGSEIIMDAPNGAPRSRGSCQILFQSIQRWC
jgi:hypothetical protein